MKLNIIATTMILIMLLILSTGLIRVIYYLPSPAGGLIREHERRERLVQFQEDSHGHRQAQTEVILAWIDQKTSLEEALKRYDELDVNHADKWFPQSKEIRVPSHEAIFHLIPQILDNDLPKAAKMQRRFKAELAKLPKK
jgi:hypothetical protein